MSAVKLVSVFSENKPGQLAKTTQVLARADINIRWVTIATTEGFGVIRFLVDRCDLACQQFRQEGFTVSLTEVLAIEVADKPGGLHAVAECLGRNQINVENSSGFISNNQAVLLIEVRNIDQARAILSDQHLRLLSQEQVMAL